MRVFISSTSEDLKDHRKVVEQVVLDAQWTPVGMEHFPNDPRPIVQLCQQAVATCDLVILLQAFRCGWVPGPEQGGDGVTSVTGWEIRAAEARVPAVPVLAFLADDDWPRRLSDLEPQAVSWVDAFRQNLNRNAKFFGWETGSLPQFRAVVRESLAIHRNRVAGTQHQPAVPSPVIQPRWVQPEPLALPDEPYPLLGPYEDPRLFGGRDAEIGRLVQLVRHPPLILCMHAPSGAGKSSLLLAGLAPRLRADGYLVSVERAPGDPGLARRLVTDVLTVDPASIPLDIDDQLPSRFCAFVAEAHALTDKPVVFVLDQIDDVLRNPEKRKQAFAAIGPLLAATAQRLPAGQGFACKWIVCYRHEFHGEVRAWLEDVLTEARAAGRKGLGLLPSDLSEASKSHDWAVPMFGRTSSEDRAGQTSRQAFSRAVMRPLEIKEDGQPRYPYVMPPVCAERIAAVFAQFRKDRPDAPLVPELQVVLNDLLRRARERAAPSGSPITIDVPEDDELRRHIHHALRHHLELALNRAFPAGRDSAAVRLAKTRALLALQRLTDEARRRAEGVSQAEFAQMLGAEGGTVLTKMAAADTRLVVVDDRGRCDLSHDCLAEAIIDVLASEGAHRNLVVDQKLIDLQRTVNHKAELYASGDLSSRIVTRGQARMIRSTQDFLIVTEAHRAWWAAVRAAHLRRRQKLSVAAAIMIVAVLAASMYLHREYERQQRYALGGELLDRVLDEHLAAAEVLDLIERNYRLSLLDRSLFGIMSYAAEEVWLRSPTSPEIRARAVEVFQKVRQAFVDFHIHEENGFQLPPASIDGDPLNTWVPLNGGVFIMGEEGVLRLDDGDAHRVTISGFSIQQHEVTNAEYRRFDPMLEFKSGREREPVVMVSWHEAAAYAAWLGASLPTEAQWEYAARGTGTSSGRRYPWGNSPPDKTFATFNTGSATSVGSHPAGRTPEGLEDMAGNVWEWCRDAYGPYRPDDDADPFGPIGSHVHFPVRRILRGGSYFNVESSLLSAGRGRAPEDERNGDVGFRLASSHFRP